MAIGAVLTCVAALLALAAVGVVGHNRPIATRIVYSASLALSSVILIVAIVRLLTWPGPDPATTLPIGLPWIGARFRIDALSAFSSSSISAPLPRAFMHSATVSTSSNPDECCRSIRRFLPE